MASTTAVRSASAASAATPDVNPLDQVSSADIALTVARMNSLPESTAINNQAVSQAVSVARATTTDNVVSKPQVVDTALKSSADIQSYTAASGDTVSSLAQRFGELLLCPRANHLRHNLPGTVKHNTSRNVSCMEVLNHFALRI